MYQVKSSSPRLISPLAATVELPTSPHGSANSSSSNNNIPKLRDSCVACASSKVRCHRQKPSCSRCLKRKIPCEYVTSKRGGRNPASGQRRSSETRTTTTTASSKAHNNAKASSTKTSARQYSSRSSTPRIDWFFPSFCGTGGAQILQPHATTTPTASTTFMDPFLSAGASASMEMDGLDSEGLGRFFGSSSSCYTPLAPGENINSLDTCMLGDGGYFGDVDVLSMAMGGNYTLPLAGSSLRSDGSISCCSPTSASPVSSSQQFPPAELVDDILHDACCDYQPNDFQCGCLLHAVGLMKQYFAHQPGDEFSVLGQTRTTALSQVQVTIARNKHVMDTMHSIMRCCFPHDSYMLLILSMILLKVLDSYADVAHVNRRSSAPGSNGSLMGRNSSICSTQKLGSLDDVRHARERSSISSCLSMPTGGYGDESRRGSIESAYSARTSLHLVLGDLHRPQRLVNQLSELLKKEAARNSGSEASVWSCSSPDKPYDFMTGGCGEAPVFSDIVWRQLGQDLRRRLQKLSLDVVEALKRE